VNDVGERKRIELPFAPAGVAGGEDDLDEHLFAPLAHVRLDHRVGAGHPGVAALPMSGQVVDRSEISVDGELVAGGVVAGGLVFEIAWCAGAVER
jgi:hypothetical protein